MRGDRTPVCTVEDVHELDRRAYGGREQSMPRICVFAAMKPEVGGSFDSIGTSIFAFVWHDLWGLFLAGSSANMWAWNRRRAR